VPVNRATSSAIDPQKIFKPRDRLLGRYSLGSRLQQLNHQPIGALALTLEIGSVTRYSCFQPRDLHLQCRDLCRQGGVAWLTMTWWPWRMPYFREIHAHQCFAIVRK
jgi:hypothetical protein